MTHRIRGLAAILFCFAAAASAAAQERGDVRIARLVERLGSSSYVERIDADRQLGEMGALPREQLERAAASPDAEVAARARQLLRQIALDELWQPSRVTLDGADIAAATVVDVMAVQTGNRILVGDRYGGFRESPVELHAEGAEFWSVIDDFCRQTNNHLRPHYDTREPGLALVRGEPGAYPLAYAGPVRATVTGALRNFSDELDYKRLTSKRTHQFRLNLELLWEDRLRVVAYRSQVELLEAVTDSGANLAVIGGSPGNWTVAGSGVRQVPIELKLEPPATTAARLAVLRFDWHLAAIGDFAEAEVAKIVPGARIEQDDLELVVDSVEEKSGSKYTLSVTIVRDRPIPDPPESLFQENRFELFDAKDRPLRLTEQTNALEGPAVRTKLVYLGSAQDGPPAKLRVNYPRLRSERKLEVVFHDVPLPTGRPE
jgi:hypothetical protein